MPGIGESNDQFGAALAVGDFDGDARDDLAIGVPGEDIGHDVAAGRVIVLRGSDRADRHRRAGLDEQDSPGIPGSVRDLHFFGQALTALDFGRSGRDDLTIGIPGHGIQGHRWAGMVVTVYGSSTGLTGTRAQGWSQASPGVKGVAGHRRMVGRQHGALTRRSL